MEDKTCIRSSGDGAGPWPRKGHRAFLYCGYPVFCYMQGEGDLFLTFREGASLPLPPSLPMCDEEEGGGGGGAGLRGRSVGRFPSLPSEANKNW